MFSLESHFGAKHQQLLIARDVYIQSCICALQINFAFGSPDIKEIHPPTFFLNMAKNLTMALSPLRVFSGLRKTDIDYAWYWKSSLS